MSKRIKQTVDSGNVHTRTSGVARGNIPNFDVEIFSPALTNKKGAEMTIDFEGRKSIKLDGRQIKTVFEVLSRHFDMFEDTN